jgi:hypothetical protein
MNKIGYIVKIKSKGREYFYLRKSVRKVDLVEKKTIYSFGSKRNAIEKILLWKENLELLPEELKKLGYGKEDILKWIEQINNK